MGPSGSLRLVHRRNRCEGRVEMLLHGTWSRVLDDQWDLNDASVVCRQLQCGVAVNFTGSAHYGEGSGQIWLDDVNCSGGEAALWDCPARPWGQHNCRHGKDAGVICSDFVSLRLENSDGCSGRLQVFYNGTWGSVCANLMTTETTSVVCRQLGCGTEGSIETVHQQGNISGPIWLDHVQCGTKNSSFWQCPSASWNPQTCNTQKEEAHITCNDSPLGNENDSGGVSVPVVICIILTVTLCLVLAFLAVQVQRARAQYRASRKSLEPFSEAVYQEIDYSQVWEKKARFGRPGLSDSSQRSLPQCSSSSSKEEEESSRSSLGDPAGGYDDAREVSDPGEDLVPGPRDWEAPREAEECAGLEEAQRDMGYDDAEEAPPVHPHEDTEAVRLDLGGNSP
ncbi:PREDICTED: antigen WC1.1-like [Tinamus guttatus]|uniref:antigen WC1.1-like n=1 Tax=Tinamus guttatus TaxID=94827 RepID=UPI00052EA699|nr:PREDICTED: antigen WC1.1-like [Tinamus guttatus]